MLMGLVLVGLLAAGCRGETVESAEPTTSTAATTAPTTTVAELTIDSLPSLALSTADLPEGFSVRQEGYVEAGEPVEAVYRRAFDPGDTVLGSSVLADLVSDIALFQSSREASRAFDGILAGLGGEQVEQIFSSIVRSYTGIEPENFNGQTLASPTIADGAVVARAFFDTPVGRAEALLYVIRAGRLHANLFLISAPGKVELEDAAVLAATVTGRMEAAVRAGEAEA
jgi:hypothetical protein